SSTLSSFPTRRSSDLILDLWRQRLASFEFTSAGWESQNSEDRRQSPIARPSYLSYHEKQLGYSIIPPGGSLGDQDMKTSRIGRWGMVLGIAFLASQVALAGGADAVTADEQS